MHTMTLPLWPPLPWHAPQVLFSTFFPAAETLAPGLLGFACVTCLLLVKVCHYASHPPPLRVPPMLRYNGVVLRLLAAPTFTRVHTHTHTHTC